MRRTLSSLIMISAIALSACGSDGTGPSSQSDLIGTWNATAIVAAPTGNPSETQDLYAEGFRLKFTFAANNTYTIISSFPGEPADSSDGTYTVSGSTLTITSSGDNEVTVITMSINGSNGTFVVQGVEIDEETANLTVTVRKE